VFTTTLGSFLPSGNTVTVGADSTGVVRAQLKAPTVAGTAIVTASVVGITRTGTIVFSPPTFTLAPVAPTPADNASVAVVTATFDAPRSVPGSSLVVSTSMGTLLPQSSSAVSATIPFDTAGTARAQIRAPNTIGTAIVTATVQIAPSTIIATKVDTISFVTATVQAVALYVSAPTITTGGTAVTVTAQLSRNPGIPTPNSSVLFTAMDPTNTIVVGSFSPQLVMPAVDSVKTSFFVPASSYTGKVNITATVTQPGLAQPVSGNSSIQLPPAAL
jgi:hypothetical protein